MPSNNLRTTRDTVVVSGYYGFDNLGDEAILEELVCELKQLVPDCRIVVLSNNPEHTRAAYDVLSVSRWDAAALLKTLTRCCLFISGGGGLFQDVRNIKSILFYGAQILLARLYKCPVVIYAQGLGPLNHAVSRWITRAAFKQASAVSVRDEASAKMLVQWGVDSIRSADPVWCLRSCALPAQIMEQLTGKGEQLRVGVCLRECTALSKEKRAVLLNTLCEALPSNAIIVPLILQPQQDASIAEDFKELLSRHKHNVVQLDCANLNLPSQWIELFKYFDLVVSMRLHALIMALKSAVPVVGIAYDPKVERLVEEFEQPCINLLQTANEHQITQSWRTVLKSGLENIEELASTAAAHRQTTQLLAQQNFELLATMLKGRQCQHCQ